MVERKSKSRGLGRGLSSLMGDLNNEPLTSNENSESQTIEKLVPVSYTHLTLPTNREV